MRALPGMTIYSPSDSLMADCIATISYNQPGPKYVRLDRIGYPLIYKDKKAINISRGFSILKEGHDLYIIATGRMVYNALQITKELSSQSINAGVIDLFRIKPIDTDELRTVIKRVGYLATLEEHFITGGIGSLISEILATKRDAPAFKPIGIPQQFCRRYGSREYLYRLNKIDVDSVTESIKKWIKK
jgi:transketolase